MYSCDCVVIGGGLAGLFSALELRRRGLRVTLLERGRAGSGASGAAGGILCPLAPWREPPPVLSLADRALVLYEQRLERYPTLKEELQSHARAGRPLLRCPGLLYLGGGRAPGTAPWLHARQYPMKKLDAADLRTLAPGLAETARGAFWLPWVQRVDSLRLVRAARTALVRAGAQVLEGETVHRLQWVKGRLRGLESSRGRYSCGYAVLAAGAWSSGLLADLRMEIGLQPVRGQMLAYQSETAAPGQILVYRGRYLIPCPPDRVLVGSTLERTGFNAAVTAHARRTLRLFATRLLPALGAKEPVAHWAGLRPATADGAPCIGRARNCGNLYLNTGHFRNGVLLAPAAAELLAHRMLDV